MPHDTKPTTDTEPTTHITHNPPHTTYIPRMIEALTMGPSTLSNIINSLPDNWEEINNIGTPITKHTLLQCIWGNQTETDGLQHFQQAIITAHPPPHTNVTQYTCHITSAISRDSTIWQHTIRNACQDHILPHPLHNPITIFNIHHHAHYTTLIADHNHYTYYDPLNFPIPPAASQIHNTLRQWYANTNISPPSYAPLLNTSQQKVRHNKPIIGAADYTCSS